ncbi:TRAP transporter substrate-binding protein [Paracoccus sp. (in: a-proteobacteria)]|uniref:TRAP transporter substrate-binding protein n=1 Tax=Paracoccus sp. TaxID=267 RepID=UPI003A8C439E
MLQTRRAAAIGLALFAGAAQAEPAKWDFSDEYDLSGMTGQAANYCIGEIEKLAGDEIDITYQGGGALGFKSTDHFDAVQDGSVEAAVTLLTQLSGIDPVFNLSSIPFVANTPEQAYQLWQAARPEYEKIFADNNMVLLWALPNAPSGIHAKKAINSVDALKGLRIRTYDVNGTETLKEAGAAPLQIAWSDLVPQLSTGGVDAVLTSADGGKQLSIWDYVDHFTEVNYAMALFVAHVNKDAFDELPEKAQAALLDTIAACDTYNWALMEEARTSPYDTMREHGMTITLDDDVPPEVFETLGNAAAKVRDAWLAETGERGAAILAGFDKMRN